MLRKPAKKGFVKVTGQGNLRNVIKEHYLRDDILCGTVGCQSCYKSNIGGSKPNLESNSKPSTDNGIVTGTLKPCPSICKLVEKPHLIIPDTNILLHHLDVLETHFFTDIVLVQTVLDEVRANNISIYNRIRSSLSSNMASTDKRVYVFSNEHHRETYLDDEGNDANLNASESDNDRNDRAIRKVTKWYQQHLEPLGYTVVLLTNDRENKLKAQSSVDNKVNFGGLYAYSLVEYCSNLAGITDELIDMLTRLDKDEIMDNEMIDTQTNAELLDGEQSLEEHQSIPVLNELLKEGKAYQGVLNCSSFNCYQGTVHTELAGELSSITISGRASINRAIHGDTVVVRLISANEVVLSKAEEEEDKVRLDMINENVSFPPMETLPSTTTNQEEQTSSRPKLPQGRIIGILKRKQKSYCGALTKKLGTAAPAGVQSIVLFVPMDRRIPWIKLKTRQASALLSKRLLVSIDGWDVKSKNPYGHLIRILDGSIGDRETETEAILLEHDVAHDSFTPQVMACLPLPDFIPSEVDLEGREDFRMLNVVSVDPPGCTDIDDALHARWIDEGLDNHGGNKHDDGSATTNNDKISSCKLIEVGVHIADVTHFVKPDTPLDREASSRATTVYLVDKRIDMLPSLLGTNLCSLKSNVDRLSFSCIWHLDPNTAEIKKVRFTKSIIRSRASFTYDEAQSRLDGIVKDESSDSLLLLAKLAKILRQRRMESGALLLASPEVRFSLDTTTTNPIDVEVKAMKEANWMVEEFMLLANISVARRLYEHFPEFALLRRHPTPPEENFTLLNEALSPYNFRLDPTTSGTLSASLDLAVMPNDSFFNRLVRIMTTRCMLQAVYFSSGTLPFPSYWHYGLACPIYTHFTSPIRRYADVLVHRLLHATISSKVNIPNCTSQQLEDVCQNLNYRNRMAQQAQRSSIELYTHLYFKGRTVIEDGYVIKILETSNKANKSVVLLIPQYGMEGLVSVERGANGEDRLKLFEKVRIRISVEEIEAGQRQKLMITLIKGNCVDIDKEGDKGMDVDANMDMNANMNTNANMNVNMDTDTSVERLMPRSNGKEAPSAGCEFKKRKGRII